ncbi:MAG: 3-oxoacyl-ACP synthase III family protein [Bacteroidales bacterium]|nr:3-oxoacyl-ACP synthase III family protein [Bacteroidales bacterium]
MRNVIIAGTGHYLPENVVKNEDFLNNTFYDVNGEKLDKPNEEIIEKLKQITGISERRYANQEHVLSDIAAFAGRAAIEDSGIDAEDLDYIIIAHNAGDVAYDNRRMNILPPIASRVKAKLNIKNPYAVAYDVPFGCPGWIEGVIQASYYLRSGDASTALVIGGETLSRIVDPHDRDGMIFSDGAGAVVLKAEESDKKEGLLSHKTRTDAVDYVNLLSMGPSNKPGYAEKELFIKMNGRKLYEYALNNVPPLVKECIDNSGLEATDIKKILIHQANEKMDEAMVKRLYKLYGQRKVPDKIMPLTLQWLGNNSVGTIPIMYDWILKNKMPEHTINPGDHLVFVAVGAGMNINAFIYKTPDNQ